MAKDLFRMAPDVCSYMSEDNNRLNIEVSMPGIDKTDIQLQMVDDSFSLSAPGKDVEYVTASAFCCPVKAAEAQATYENGCLKITIPFKDPFENAVRVEIN
jgi:HSP20 family molecular chaperone IbpA